MKKLILILFTTFFIWTTFLFSQSIYINKTQKILIKAEEDENSNVQIFVDNLKKILPFLEVKINQEMEDEDVLKIYIGKHKEIKSYLNFDNLHPYGYYIKTPNKNILIIAGKIITGTTYGIYDFLKRFCGYRQFGPTSLYEIIPPKDNIEIPLYLEIKEEPSFDSWCASFGGLTVVNEFFYRNLRATLPATHNFFNIFPPEKFAKEHPEYYPFVKGTRFVPPASSIGQWQPCVSNPDVVKVAIDYAKEWIESIGKENGKVRASPFVKNYYLKRNPYLKGIMMGVNDGDGDCLCTECKKLKEKYGNQYIPFYNEVASAIKKQYPDKFICFIAYQGSFPPPENIKLEPNIFVEITKLHKDLGENFEVIEKWRQAGAKKIGIYDYLYGGGYVVPRYYPHVLCEYWKEIYKKYNEEVFPSTVECNTEVWLYDGPKNYILSELAWDINKNVDFLIDDYFKNFYGESSEPMKNFFTRIEEIYKRKKNPYFFVEDWKKISQFEEYSYDDLKFLNEKIKKAMILAKNEKIRERVELFNKIWNLSALFIEGYLVYKDLKLVNITNLNNEKIDKVIEKARKGLKICEEIDNYSLNEFDEKNIFTLTTLEKYKNQRTIRIDPYLEMEIDRIFTAITDLLKKRNGSEFAKKFWIKKIEEEKNKKMKSFYLTQVFMMENKNLENLVKNNSFEQGSEKNRIPDWTVWEWPQTEVEFGLDEKEAHTGKKSFYFGENNTAAVLYTKIKVSPGERYKVSFWVKQTIPYRKAYFAVDWQDNGGWLYRKEVTKAWKIEIPYPENNAENWNKVSFTFTVPEEAEICVLLFNAPIQGKKEKIWFDDVEVIKIYEASLEKK